MYRQKKGERAPGLSYSINEPLDHFTKCKNAPIWVRPSSYCQKFHADFRSVFSFSLAVLPDLRQHPGAGRHVVPLWVAPLQLTTQFYTDKHCFRSKFLFTVIQSKGLRPLVTIIYITKIIGRLKNLIPFHRIKSKLEDWKVTKGFKNWNLTGNSFHIGHFSPVYNKLEQNILQSLALLQIVLHEFNASFREIIGAVELHCKFDTLPICSNHSPASSPNNLCSSSSQYNPNLHPPKNH